MAWQVIEIMDQNPDMSMKEVVAHLAESMDVDQQIESVKNEVESVLLLREQLRPLHGKKFNAEQQLVSLNSEFEMDVMSEYPKGVGSDKIRKAYKVKLQNNSEQYLYHKQVIEEMKEKIEQLDEELFVVQDKAKNARRILETFNNYVNFILACRSSESSVPMQAVTKDRENDSMF